MMDIYSDKQKIIMAALDEMDKFTEYFCANHMAYEVGGKMLAGMWISDALHDKQSELYQEVELMWCDEYVNENLEWYFRVEEGLSSKIEYIAKLKAETNSLKLDLLKHDWKYVALSELRGGKKQQEVAAFVGKSLSSIKRLVADNKGVL